MKFEDLSENQKALLAMMTAHRTEAKVNFLIKEFLTDDQALLRLKAVLDELPPYPIFEVSDAQPTP